VTVQVRPARPADVSQLLDLIQQHATFERTVASLSEADLAAILGAPQPPTRLIVADDGIGLVGYAALTFDYALWSASRFAHLDCLFVRDTMRGRRIGKHLFDETRRLAEAAGASRIEWQTPAWNVDAIRFYEREGGRDLAKMRFGLSVDPAVTNCGEVGWVSDRTGYGYDAMNTLQSDLQTCVLNGSRWPCRCTTASRPGRGRVVDISGRQAPR
jgi:GNAT superfamily N-acetyltransferase